MLPVELLNQTADAWARYMVGGLIDGGILLLVLWGVWLLLRRRVSPQFGYCLFLLVLVRVAIPWEIPAPAWYKTLSPSQFVGEILKPAHDGAVDAVQSPAVVQTTSTHFISAGNSPNEESASPTEGPVQAAVGSSAVFENGHPNRAAVDVDFATAGANALPSKADLRQQVDLAVQPNTDGPALSVAAWMMLGWAIVVSALLAWAVLLHRRLWRVMSRAIPIEPYHIAINLDELRHRAGVRQSVSLLVSDELTSPAVAGLWKPRIVLPVGIADMLTPDQLRWVILHELVHIRRYDLWFTAFQKFVQTIHFFNPAVWLANMTINRQREYVCDDVALASADVSRRECGAAFLKIAATVNRQPTNVPVPLSFLRFPSPYRRRLMKILDKNRPLRTRLNFGSILLLAIIAVAVIPRLRPDAVAQDAPKSPVVVAQSNGQLQSQADDAQSAGRLTSPPPAAARREVLETRLNSLENELRALRKLLQEPSATTGDPAGSIGQRTVNLFVPVERRNLAIVGTQRGTIVACPSGLTSHPQSRVKITQLIEEDSRVKKGDVVVQFDTGDLQDGLNLARIKVEQAKATRKQATRRYDNQRAQSESDIASSELVRDLAKMDFENYEPGEYAQQKSTLHMKVEEAKLTRATVKEAVAKGLSSAADLKKAENALAIVMGELRILEGFTYVRQMKELAGAFKQAELQLERTKLEADNAITAAKADLAAAEQALKNAEERQKSLESAIENTQLLAPIDGLVKIESRLVKEGASVRARQPILAIIPVPTEPEENNDGLLEGVLVIPVAAVHRSGTQTYCIVQTANGLEQRTIELGNSNEALVEVVEGLEAGEKVLQGRVNLVPPSRDLTPPPRR